MVTPAEIEAELTQPGAPFEIVEETVLGAPSKVFRQRTSHLRAMLEGSLAAADSEYIVYEDRRISFGQHAQAVASVAKALSTQYRVRRGDRVAILAANCPEWIVSFWAATSLGAIAVGLNGWWSGDEISFGVADCDPKLLIGDRKRLARLEGDAGVPVVEIESDFEKLWNYDLAASLPTNDIDEDDAAVLLYTSGTTGRPKGAVNTHRNVVAVTSAQFFHGARMMIFAARSGAVQTPTAPTPVVSLINNPLFHVSGLYPGAVMGIASRIKTVWMSGRFDPLRVMETLERERVTNWSPMGTMAWRVVNHPEVGRFDFSQVRNVGSGGAPLAPHMQERLREVFPGSRTSMGVGYGLTESTALATLNHGADLEAHPTSVGRPIPTVDLEVRDAQGRALGEGEEGEIFVRGPVVMKEYWGNPAATAEVIGPGRWLRTGDVGHLADGRLYINSRKRDLILRGGENIYPVEIEQRLEAHADVREAAVVGVASEEFGQEVKAIVVPVGGRTPATNALAEWVGAALAKFKVPAHWELRSEPLPRNATGKVMKHVLVGDAENPFVEE